MAENVRRKRQACGGTEITEKTSCMKHRTQCVARYFSHFVPIWSLDHVRYDACVS